LADDPGDATVQSMTKLISTTIVALQGKPLSWKVPVVSVAPIGALVPTVTVLALTHRESFEVPEQAGWNPLNFKFLGQLMENDTIWLRV
jgi:hypothetical protein